MFQRQVVREFVADLKRKAAMPDDVLLKPGDLCATCRCRLR